MKHNGCLYPVFHSRLALFFDLFLGSFGFRVLLGQHPSREIAPKDCGLAILIVLRLSYS